MSRMYNGNQSSTSWIYDLYEVIYHSGTIGFGHYYSIIRNDIKSDDWHLFNGNTYNLNYIRMIKLTKLKSSSRFNIF